MSWLDQIRSKLVWWSSNPIITGPTYTREQRDRAHELRGMVLAYRDFASEIHDMPIPPAIKLDLMTRLRDHADAAVAEVEAIAGT